MWAEFKAFLIKQNALALAIAFVIGAALNTVVQSIVNDVIMPIVAVLTPSGDWQKAVWQVGPVEFGVGNLASAVLNFLIIGFVAWRLSKLFIREPAPAAAPATKVCPYCRMSIDAAASRCPHCTSALSEGAPANALGAGAAPVRG
ncbi:MAG TPA: MscL family protein [Gemmatimonadaceae bacterium]|nr:MscL family protein [Gemmatimonadaceae bacterium]